MANGNPYYVHPGQDFGQGLSGLAGAIMHQKELRREEQEKQDKINRFASAKQKAMEAFRSGDASKMAEVSIEYPEISQTMNRLIGFHDSETEKNYKESLFDLYSNPTAENASRLVMSRQGMLNGKGVKNTSETDGFMAKFESDPERAIDQVEMELAWRYPEQFKSMRKAMNSSDGGEKYKVVGGRLVDISGPNPKVVVDKDPENTGKYDKISGEYRNFLISNDLDPSADAYKKWQDNKKRAKEEIGSNKYPYLSKLMAQGWMPSTRITTPMMDAYESAARRADELGEPLTADKLYDMEFKAVQNRATGRTAGGRLTLQRKQNIAAASGLMEDMEKTASKLDYSDIAFVGALDKFRMGQLNDPIFTEYMTQRADALFVLGNALKQNGLTDKSIEVEEEAARPTMSPRAFKAWYNTQMRALNRAADELNQDFKYGIELTPTVPPGQGGEGFPESGKTVRIKPLSEMTTEELMELRKRYSR